MTQTEAMVKDGYPHVLVVDDDARLRQLLQKYLSDNDFRVTTAADAAEARQKLGGFAFDILVLDVMMPGENGLQLTQSLRETSEVPILLLTAMGEAEDRIAGLESGADDYLVKPFEPRELVLRLRNILKRRQDADSLEELPDLKLGDFTFDRQRGELLDKGKPVHLTSGEAALLRILAETPGQTVGRLELTERTGSGSERSVDVQVTRLRRKIEEDPKAPRFLQTVWGEGYVLKPE